ncbi:MAG: citryl-CoA lyase [Nanoarchaeota archaeon]|nr:citryl-CoA lyase [Nanoarchaeota archaeon]
MEYKTRISKVHKNDIIIRGKNLSSLINSGKLSDVIFLQLSGRTPEEKESIIFEKMLISIIDHGMGVTSSMTSRFIASGGNGINVAVGGGILSLGDYHGGAVEKTMQQFLNWKKDDLAAIRELIQQKKTIYGFGHKHYHDGDPRVQFLIKEMQAIGFESQYLEWKELIEQLFEEIKGKKLHLNIDGLIAILLCDFNFDPMLGKGIFIIGRTPGLVAQAHEELKYEKPVRRIEEDEITYIGDDDGFKK